MGQRLRGRVRAGFWLCVATTAAFHASTSSSASEMGALPLATPSIAAGTQARPMKAWVKFCEQAPRECEVDRAEPALIPLTYEVWRKVVAVNLEVNNAIKPRSDRVHWGVEDRWDYPDDGFGDCEDYQLLKRKILVEAGLPRRAMRMTVVIDDEGAGHAVMMVRTDKGDFILDNKKDEVLPWTSTGYTYVKQEGSNGLGWASLGGRSSPVATANR
jgi:predicted transglutaminase-like cysteine proteinase